MLGILYVSSLCSSKTLDYIFKTSKAKPEQAAQKFHRLLTEGIVNVVDSSLLEVLSSLPITPTNHAKKIWRLQKEVSNGVKYRYIPFLNLPILKNVLIFFYTFFRVLIWSLSNHKDSKFVIVDVLNLTTATASQLACKIVGTKCISIVTDIPGFMVPNVQTKSFKKINPTGMLYTL